MKANLKRNRLDSLPACLNADIVGRHLAGVLSPVEQQRPKIDEHAARLEGVVHCFQVINEVLRCVKEET
jgi:hypothetical protein